MPIGINNLELLRWYKQPGTAFGKSVQRPWMFWGFFIFNPFKGISTGKSLWENVKAVNKEFPPVIQPFHIIDVNVPTYTFKREVMMYGQVPRSFPVLDFHGFDLKMTLEEDEQGTVDYFVNWNQRNIIDSEGYYNSPNDVKLNAFVLEIQDKMGIPIVYYIFHDILFQHADDVNYSYESGGSVRRSLTFGCDRMSTVYIKQNAVAATAGLIADGATLFKDFKKK